MDDKHPKPVRRGPTPGPWIFDEGDPGYPDTRLEPGDPGYAPYIYAPPPEGFGYDPDDEDHQIKIAEIFPTDLALPLLDYEPESAYDEGRIDWGDYTVNGKLMAKAPEMWNLLLSMRDRWGESIRLCTEAGLPLTQEWKTLTEVIKFVEEFEAELKKR